VSPLPLASEEIGPLIDALGLSDDVRATAATIAEKADYEWPINRSASVVAAGVVYAASIINDEQRTQHEIAAAADVSTFAVRYSYQDLIEHSGANDVSGLLDGGDGR